MLITKTIEIDMGHRVPNHKSKCRNPHGHRYKFEIGVNDKVIKTKGASDEGMVIDFGDLKEVAMNTIDGQLDHGFMIYNQDKYLEFYQHMRDEDGMKIIVVDFIPTAENICEYVFKLMDRALFKYNIRLQYIKVWETPTSTAEYHRGL